MSIALRISAWLWLAVLMGPCLAKQDNLDAKGEIREQWIFNFDSAPVNKARAINFPDKYSLGGLSMANSTFKYLDRHCKSIGQAQGQVIVPPHFLVRLAFGPKFYSHIKEFSNLRCFPVDGVKISLTALDERDEGLCDKAMQLVSTMETLQDLDLDRSDTTDSGLVQASKLKGLRRLSINESQIKGSCFKSLTALHDLRCLRISANPIEVSNLQYLSSFALLERLSVSRLQLKDSDLSYIMPCKKLAFLDISRNGALSDEGLKKLGKLTALRVLNINETRVSPSGLTAFKGGNLVEVFTSADFDVQKASAILPGCTFKPMARTTEFADSVLAPLH